MVHLKVLRIVMVPIQINTFYHFFQFLLQVHNAADRPMSTVSCTKMAHLLHPKLAFLRIT